MPAGDVTVTLNEPVGWERLRLIVDIRRARDTGLIRHIDGRVLLHRNLPAELKQRMASHRDLLQHALTYDLEAQ